MEDKIICLVGASGSGKTTLCKNLEDKNFNIIKSYTTRNPRYEGEWGHIFIDDWFSVEVRDVFVGVENGLDPDGTDFKYIDIDDMVAYKELYGNHYFATKEQYQGKGTSIYIVDPDGAEQVKENVKDAEIVTIFLMADRQTRMIRLRSRFDSNYDKEEYANNNSKYREDLREGVYERIYNDSSIFKTCKCDYVVDANREVEDVLEEVVEIIC